jgi:hypothetical protein
MKTISITDEMYLQLIELSNEMNSQNNRSTANVFFQIEDIEFVPAWEGRSDLEELYGANIECSLRTDEEIKEHCYDYYIDILNFSEEQANDFFNNYNSSDFRKYLIDELDFEPLPYAEKKVYTNAFLTAKECDEHIQGNKHHYTPNAQSFGSCAWRNSGMELISNFIKSLT